MPFNEKVCWIGLSALRHGTDDKRDKIRKHEGVHGARGGYERKEEIWRGDTGQRPHAGGVRGLRDGDRETGE